MTFVDRIRAAARNRVAYHRTVAELSRLPATAREDLGLYGDDIRDLARRAVYGA